MSYHPDFHFSPLLPLSPSLPPPPLTPTQFFFPVDFSHHGDSNLEGQLLPFSCFLFNIFQAKIRGRMKDSLLHTILPSLHYTVLHCTILHYTILHYTILHYTITYYTILYSLNVFYSFHFISFLIRYDTIHLNSSMYNNI